MGVRHRFMCEGTAAASLDASAPAPAQHRPPCHSLPPGWTPPASGSSTSAHSGSSLESRPRHLADAPIVAGTRVGSVLGDDGDGLRCASPCLPSVLRLEGMLWKTVAEVSPNNQYQRSSQWVRRVSVLVAGRPSHAPRVDSLCSLRVPALAKRVPFGEEGPEGDR